MRPGEAPRARSGAATGHLTGELKADSESGGKPTRQPAQRAPSRGAASPPDAPVLLDSGESSRAITVGDRIQAADPTPGEHVDGCGVTARHINYDNDLIHPSAAPQGHACGIACPTRRRHVQPDGRPAPHVPQALVL